MQLTNTAGFEHIHPLVLDGEIGIAILWGGAYVGFQGGLGEAKALGQKFCSGLFDNQYEQMLAFRSVKPWSSWFFDVAWDYSWFFFDATKSQIHVVFGTDTD